MSFKRLALYTVALAIISLVLFSILKHTLLVSKAKKNVIVLLLDTLRSDHLSVYGYQRNTTPVLDKFAKENSLYKHAISAAPWTPPSVAAIFTGLYPTSHAMMPPANRKVAVKKSKTLSTELNTLSKVFTNAGYQTAAVSSNPWIGPEFGYNQGFQDFTHITRANAEQVNESGLKLIDKFNKKQPFFLYLHYLDPHDPYNPPEEYAKIYQEAAPIVGANNHQYSEKMQNMMDLYDGEIAYLDFHLGKLFEKLKELSLYEDTIIVIVGDHGEQFMEQGEQGHGYYLYNTETHVPLMVKAPLFSAQEVQETVSTIDIYPTLLKLNGIQAPAGLQGINLLDSESIKSREGVLSEINHKVSQKSFTNLNGRKIVYDCGVSLNKGGTEEKCQTVIGIFDRQKDYLELKPSEDQSDQDELEDEFKRSFAAALKMRKTGEGQEIDIPEDTLNDLKSLGYL